LSHHFAEVAEEGRESDVMASLGDVLRSAVVTVLDVAGEPRVWKVDESRRQLLEAVASTEVQQRRTVVRRQLRCVQSMPWFHVQLLRAILVQ